MCPIMRAIDRREWAARDCGTAVFEMRVRENGVASDGIERDGLGVKTRGGRNADCRVHEIRVRDRPLQDLHAAHGAADHRQQVPDAQLVQQ